MLASQVPPNLNIPFANNAGAGFIRTIPQASQVGIIAGAASLTDGFPPQTFSPVVSGGIPPFGQDFNGILNWITAWMRWQQAGGTPSYNPAFSAAIVGYPLGAVLQNAAGNGFWRSLVDGNLSNPDTGGAGWGILTPASYPWTSITGHPTDLAGFTNGPGYITSAAISGMVLGSQFTGANQSLAGTGYQQLPGGLIVQWGTTASFATDTVGNIVTFPLAFPVGCFVVEATASTDNGINVGAVNYGWGINNKTATGFKINNDAAPSTFDYIAIGH